MSRNAIWRYGSYGEPHFTDLDWNKCDIGPYCLNTKHNPDKPSFISEDVLYRIFLDSGLDTRCAALFENSVICFQENAFRVYEIAFSLDGTDYVVSSELYHYTSQCLLGDLDNVPLGYKRTIITNPVAGMYPICLYEQDVDQVSGLAWAEPNPSIHLFKEMNDKNGWYAYIDNYTHESIILNKEGEQL